jgi:tripartite-type tricarboxylate transporter receptor subunit TctC
MGQERPTTGSETMMLSARAVAALATLTLSIVFAAAAEAQTKWPTGPVRFIVPYAPGGATDVSSRILAEHLKPIVGENIVVENKVGASGLIALEEMMRSKADGNTVMIGNVSTNGLTPILLKHKLGKIDYLRDVSTVARVADGPVYLLATMKDFPPTTFQDFIAYAKKNPGKLKYSSAGHGSVQQVDTAVLASKTGIDMIHIPTKAGAAQMNRDMISGDTQITWGTPASSGKFVEAGQMRALAVVGSERLKQFPNVPTFHELGLPDVGSLQWQSMIAPAAVPKETLEAIYAAVAKAWATQAMQDAMARVGFVQPKQTSLAANQAWYKSEYARYSKIIADLNIKAEE